MIGGMIVGSLVRAGAGGLVGGWIHCTLVGDAVVGLGVLRLVGVAVMSTLEGRGLGFGVGSGVIMMKFSDGLALLKFAVCAVSVDGMPASASSSMTTTCDDGKALVSSSCKNGVIPRLSLLLSPPPSPLVRTVTTIVTVAIAKIMLVE